ncbi:MAG TPA: tetratricopeptide repeat protein [Vicinamibacteria bacterium]|jgi:tetratricopeptide (TPR) repeat protein
MRGPVIAAWLAVGIGLGRPAGGDEQQGPGVDPSEAIRESRALIDAGQPRAAIEKLKLLDLGDPRVAQVAGVAYYHADDPVKAIELLKPVVDKLPPESLEGREAVQVLGLSLYIAQHLAEAIPYLEKTRAWAPDNLELLYVLGNAYVQTRQADPARGCFARLFGVALDSAGAHLLTAHMMVRLEFEELAEAELRKAVAKDPRLPQAHFLLGQAALFRSRWDEAVGLMQKELEINPGSAMALYRLGEIYTRQSRWDEAIAALQKSLWINPAFSGPYILLGKAYTKKGQPEAAEGMLRRAVQYDPNNKAAHYLLAQLLQQTGRADEAKKEFEIAERLQDAADR